MFSFHFYLIWKNNKRNEKTNQNIILTKIKSEYDTIHELQVTTTSFFLQKSYVIIIIIIIITPFEVLHQYDRTIQK